MAEDTIKLLEEEAKKLIEASKDQLVGLTKIQAKLAIENLKNVGEVAAKQGKVILEEMKRVALLVQEGKLLQKDAELVMAEHWLALENVGKGVERGAARESYNRGKAYLKGAQTIALGVATTGLSLLAPALGRAVDGALAQVTEKLA